MKVERTLLIAGLALFLVGLLSGMAVSATLNPRAGLAAHLEGVMNGTFLVAVAAAWPRLALGPRSGAAARALLVFGATDNFLATQLSAILGTSGLTPIAGAGFTGASWAEGLVSAMLMATVPTMVPAVAILLWGAIRATEPAGA